MKFLSLFFVLGVLFVNINQSSLWANDAFTFPKHVSRVTLNTSIVSIVDQFDSEGEKSKLFKSSEDSAKLAIPGASLDPQIDILREDFAVEYGVTDKVSLQIQVPVYFASKFSLNANDDMATALTLGGKKSLLEEGESESVLGDIIVGAKWQYLSNGQTPVSTDPGTYRAAIAAGLALPTGELADPLTTNIGTTKSGADTYILGLRTYWDYQFTKYFFVNFYTEHEYRLAGDYKTISSTGKALDITYQPGVYNYLELDFNVTPELFSQDVTSLSGLYLIGEFTAEGEYSDYPEGYAGVKEEEASKIYYVKPYVGATYKGGLFPMSLQLSYLLPVAGENAKATDIIELKYKAYFKFI